VERLQKRNGIRKGTLISMERSKAYFTNLRTTPERNILKKPDKLVRKAGIEEIDFKKQHTAIKRHLGESGNLTP